MYCLILWLFIVWSITGIISVILSVNIADKQTIADVIYLCGDFKLILISGPIVWVIYWYKAYHNSITNVNKDKQ